MSTNPLELPAVYGGPNKPATDSLPAERRRRARNHLHWAVLLFRDHAEDAVESLTRNLSSSGFYCLSEVAFTPGERLVCTLKVPSHDPKGKLFEQGLECQVRGLGVAPQSQEVRFVVPRRIEDYLFTRATTERELVG